MTERTNDAGGGAGDAEPGEESESWFAGLLDAGEVGVWSISTTTHRTLYANAALARLVGRPREELFLDGASLIPWLHPDDREAAQEGRRAAMESGAAEGAWRLIRPDGEVRWIRVRARAFPEPGRLDLLIVDETAQHEMEASLRSSERRLRRILERSWGVTGLFDADRRVLDLFGPVEAILGCTAEEYAAMPVDKRAHPAELAGIADLWRRVLVAPGAEIRGEVRRPRKDGGWRWTENVAVNMLGDPDVGAVVVNTRDISARKLAEEALAAARTDAAQAEERERRRVAIDLHDRIGQALALAQIQIEALAESGPAALRPRLAECVGTIAGVLNEVRTLTFELDLPILRDLGLKAAVGWLADQLAAQHDLVIEVDGPDLAELDDGLASTLFRVTRELLTNVVKHARSPSARVVLVREEARVGVDVIDAGAGFDAVAAFAKPDRRYGLASVREDLARLGGTLVIDSSPGAGAWVKARLPAPRG